MNGQNANNHTYDAIVVGAGAAGGVVACLLAEAGKHVLLLERGRNLSFADVGRDHLRNQRISLYGHNAGPNIVGNPRTFAGAQKTAVVRPHEGGYGNNAGCVGGGTRVYGAQAWRFLPADFHMATLYGVPEGSSLADWPITYDDLEPFYERVEWALGVAGKHPTGNPNLPDRQRGYPLPPVPPTLSSQALQRGADALGWNTLPVPLAINTQPYGGRGVCIQCQHCVGFACPTDAKNGSQNTYLPRALATGLCELVTEAQAERVSTDAQGRVTGVSYFVMRDGQTERITATAKTVVVSAAAVESARLLLLSATDRHPHGLGNEHDQVGRHLQGHYYPGALGLMEENVWDGIGPGPSIATTDFNHGNAGVIGGGMLANEFIKLPIIHWKGALPPDVPSWGPKNKAWMRDNYTRTLQVTGPVQEIPSPEGRVTLDPDVRDHYGLPVVRLSGAAHPETVRTSHRMWERARQWLHASGATKLWGDPPGLFLSGGQHQAGTCRMGDDPRTSVTDKWGRVHNHDNLYVIDGSLHVTNGGFNPFLTIMALAQRSGEHLARSG